MLWGLLKKVVVADNLAPEVDAIFRNHESLSAPTLWVGAVYFAIQIYCDFSGYSDIAIGTARLLGFNLTRNFANPYFSRNVGEFWRRWHISLSSWFRDYVYIPLGGSRTTKGRYFVNLLATFTLSGLWHGANWTFVIWGALHGLYYLPLVLRARNRQFTSDVVAAGRWLQTFREAGAVSVTFFLVLIAWVFFRARSLGHALDYLHGMFAGGWSMPTNLLGFVYVVGLLSIEWIQREKPHALEISGLPMPLRWTIYYLLAIVILVYRAGNNASFIYFQF